MDLAMGGYTVKGTWKLTAKQHEMTSGKAGRSGCGQGMSLTWIPNEAEDGARLDGISGKNPAVLTGTTGSGIAFSFRMKDSGGNVCEAHNKGPGLKAIYNKMVAVLTASGADEVFSDEIDADLRLTTREIAKV